MQDIDFVDVDGDVYITCKSTASPPAPTESAATAVA
jgi:hypothetical protein